MEKLSFDKTGVRLLLLKENKTIFLVWNCSRNRWDKSRIWNFQKCWKLWHISVDIWTL